MANPFDLFKQDDRVDDRVQRWAAAVALAAFALAARALLQPHHPYFILFLGVVFSAWYLGAGPAILTAIVGMLGTLYLLGEPRDLIHLLWGSEHSVGVGAFVIASSITIVFGQRARQTAAKLKHAEWTLEGKVQERTAELLAANERLRKLSVRIMQIQDQERRDIARELHDGIGQILAALAMNHDLISPGAIPSNAKPIADSQRLIQEAIQQTRTISHLLHPPLLDEVGLHRALETFIDGFSERCRITTTLEAPIDMGPFPPDLEISIFRIVQECLTNIHKHSHAKAARVSLECRNDEVLVIVKDDGIGIPKQHVPGVGLRGMRERVQNLGGAFQVESCLRGTAVTATFPLS